MSRRARAARLLAASLAGLLAALAALAAHAQTSFAETWARPEAGRARLVQAIEEHRRFVVAGGWPEVSDGPKLQPGDAGPRVSELRLRLGFAGEPGTFDGTVAAAVRAFQERHGLLADGVVGRATLAALNAPADRRLAQLRLALARWDRLPIRPGEDAVVVNLPAMRLAAIEGGAPALEMRVVIGRPDWPTPEFSSAFTMVTFSPTWTVPRRIAASEVEPRARRDPAYLARNGIEVVDQAGRSLGYDLGAVKSAGVPYMLRQRPGDANALGRVRLTAPNPYDVFLHDTPARSLFARPARAFSHGCIRLERPLDLARWLLADQPRWDDDAVGDAISRPEPLPVPVTRRVALHVVYLSAWVEPSGMVHFRPDIYGSDKAMSDRIAAPPAPSGDCRAES